MTETKLSKNKSVGLAKAQAARRGKPNNIRGKDGLTAKEREFCLHYIGAARHNATEAAFLTGYGKGVRKQCATYGAQLLTKSHIAAQIQRLTEERNQRLEYTADDVLRELIRLKTDAEVNCPKSAPGLRVRLDILKTVGEHVAVNAFRRQLGLSAPNGGPIETADAVAMSKLTDEELDTLERARSILDRTAGKAGDPDSGPDQGGAGETPQGE